MHITRVRILKDWEWPRLERQTPGGSGRWDGVEFLVGEGDEPCDLTVVLNNRLRQDARTTCPSDRVWVLMQEPYARGLTDWMVEGLDAYALVLTHHPHGIRRPTRISQPALPWHVNRSYDELRSAEIPRKTGEMSWILGSGRGLRGHRVRMDFFEALRRAEPRVNLFGRAIRPLEDKWDGLAPYRFSLAIENSSSPHYWTEKIADCFLAWTVPLYWGAPDIAEFFPKDAFIQIDIRDPESAMATIRSVLSDPEAEWSRRLEALSEARRLVLERYQIFPHITALARAHAPNCSAQLVHRIPAYRRSFRAAAYRSLRKMVHVGGWF